MSLVDLAKYFTIFSNNGILKSLKIYLSFDTLSEKIVAKSEYIQLINKILTDRATGAEQFGVKSDLNLFQKNYLVKTGTSRNFKDSWVIGFTPDFLVGVWVGNADNSATDGVSGQLGAGKIWVDIMELLFNSVYNKKNYFDFNLIEEFYGGEGVEYGLKEDDYEKLKKVLKEDFLILYPHDKDIFRLEKDTKIVLNSKESVLWFINEKLFDRGKEIIFVPVREGKYKISAKKQNGFNESTTILIFR